MAGPQASHCGADHCGIAWAMRKSGILVCWASAVEWVAPRIAGLSRLKTLHEEGITASLIAWWRIQYVISYYVREYIAPTEIYIAWA